ncbi:MAG: hypothetical protein ABI865_13855 [Nitrosospira sp.]
MTYLEIYQNVKRLIPAGLREKYDHLSYGEMAEVAELSQWADGLRWAEAQWEKIALQDESINIDERMQGG